MTPPCGVPCLLALPPSMRLLPSPSVVSTGALSHCLISRSMSPSTMRRAIDCISSSCGMVSKDLLRSASTTSVWPCRSRTITAWIASVALRFGRVIRVAQDVRSPDLVVEQIEPEVRLPLRLAIEFPLQSPDRIWRLQAHRQSPHLVCFENAPEVRDLPSTRVTRLPRYDDPVRLPRGPAPCSAVEAATPVQHGSPPLTRSPVSTCCSHYPGGPVRVRLSAASPYRAAFPILRLGRRPQLPFRGLLRIYSHYGPSICLTAQGGLCRRASTRPVARQSRLPATGPTDHCPGGTSTR